MGYQIDILKRNYKFNFRYHECVIHFASQTLFGIVIKLKQELEAKVREDVTRNNDDFLQIAQLYELNKLSFSRQNKKMVPLLSNL